MTDRISPKVCLPVEPVGETSHRMKQYIHWQQQTATLCIQKLLVAKLFLSFTRNDKTSSPHSTFTC